MKPPPFDEPVAAPECDIVAFYQLLSPHDCVGIVLTYEGTRAFDMTVVTLSRRCGIRSFGRLQFR
jgi:hypothetical protein